MSQRKSLLCLVGIFVLALVGAIAIRTLPPPPAPVDREVPVAREHELGPSEAPVLVGTHPNPPDDDVPSAEPDQADTAKLTLRVIDVDSKDGLEACEVSIYSLAPPGSHQAPLAFHDRVSAQGETDSDGYIRVACSKGTTQVILVARSGYATARTVAQCSDESVTIELEPAGSVFGTIKAPTGAPLSGVSVSALPVGGSIANASTADLVRSRTSAADLPPAGQSSNGEFSIGGLGAGNYHLALSPADWRVVSIKGLRAGGVVRAGDGPVEIVAAPVKYFAVRPVLGDDDPIGVPFFLVRVADADQVFESPSFLTPAELERSGIRPDALERAAPGTKVGRALLRDEQSRLDMSIEAPLFGRKSFTAQLMTREELSASLRVQDVSVTPDPRIVGAGTGTVVLKLEGESLPPVGRHPTALLRVALDGMTRAERQVAGDLGREVRDVHILGRRIDERTWEFLGVPSGDREADARIGPVETATVRLRLSRGGQSTVAVGVASLSGVILSAVDAETGFPVLDIVYTIERLGGNGMWSLPPTLGQQPSGGLVDPEVVPLSPGTYRITVTRPGYARASTEEAIVDSGSLKEVRVELRRE